jgi:predicted small lipoprotein YifL
MRGVGVRSLSDRRIVYVGVAAVLGVTLMLAGCGRKAGLDAPPSSTVPAGPPQADAQSSLGQSGPIFMGPPSLTPEPQQAPPQTQTASTSPQPQKSFFLDWLLK